MWTLHQNSNNSLRWSKQADSNAETMTKWQSGYGQPNMTYRLFILGKIIWKTCQHTRINQEQNNLLSAGTNVLMHSKNWAHRLGMHPSDHRKSHFKAFLKPFFWSFSLRFAWWRHRELVYILCASRHFDAPDPVKLRENRTFITKQTTNTPPPGRWDVQRNSSPRIKGQGFDQTNIKPWFQRIYRFTFQAVRPLHPPVKLRGQTKRTGVPSVYGK